MKIKLLNLIMALLFAVQTFAQTDLNPSKNGLLWEVSGKGIKEKSYLFGTYHLIGKSFTDTLPALMKVFNASKLIIGEIVVDSDAEMGQKMMPFMTLNTTSLDQIFSKEEYNEIDEFLKAKTGAPLAAFNGFKPFVVQLLLVQKIAPGDASAENTSLDMFFQREGKKNGKTIFGFETIEQQAQLLLNSSIEKQKADLLKTVRESARYIKESKDFYDAYKIGNINKIEKAFTQTNDFTPEELKKLVTDRNIEWMKVIPAYLAKGNAFIAVGAGHLPGNEGLLNLLKAQGYTLKAISIK